MNVRRLRLRLLSASLAALPAAAVAQPFDLLVSTPDIVSSFVSVTYTASATPSGNFVASGFPTNISFGAGDPTNPIGPTNSFSLVANVSTTGALVDVGGSFGTVTIIGAVNLDGITGFEVPSQTLLTGSITGFDAGLAAGGSPTSVLEFRVSITGGYFAANYTGAPSYGTYGAGVILSSSGIPVTRFGSSWSTSFSAQTDTSVLIPEPGAGVVLAAVAPAGLATAGRRRRAGSAAAC